jgi:hypothetical protein
MDLKQYRITSLIVVGILLFLAKASAQDTYDQQHIEVSMRMIGHQILLNSDDSSSLVLPVEKENDRYRIQFESEFEFVPEELVMTVNRIVIETGIAKGYILEVEKCDTKEVVYSYEMGDLEKIDIIPCTSRVQPKSCYSLLFTLIETRETKSVLPGLTSDSYAETSQLKTVVVVLLLLIAGVFSFLWRRRSRSRIDPNLIPLGEFKFDKKNAKLIIEHQEIELSSKEADLLLLLYDAVNTTVERELILNMVWGDEGDYVGRTLDVFISKLRKKLEADSKVKIVNIRGVGYKLIMNE